MFISLSSILGKLIEDYYTKLKCYNSKTWTI